MDWKDPSEEAGGPDAAGSRTFFFFFECQGPELPNVGTPGSSPLLSFTWDLPFWSFAQNEGQENIISESSYVSVWNAAVHPFEYVSKCLWYKQDAESI